MTGREIDATIRAMSTPDLEAMLGVRRPGQKPPRSVQRMKQLCVALDPDTMREVNEAAKRAGITRSQWTRLVIEWGLMENVS